MKNKKVLISIICPIYNCRKYIQNCISSILNQTYQNFEVLLVDDGSEDNVDEIISTLDLDNRFHYVRKENGGPSSARNLGIVLSKGEYISFIDADDTYESSFLESLLKLSMKFGTDISCCYLNNVNVFGSVYTKSLKSNKIQLFNASELNLLESNIDINHNSILIRRSFLGNTRYKEGLDNSEDNLFVFQLFCKKPKICILDFPLYNYFCHDNITSL